MSLLKFSFLFSIILSAITFNSYGKTLNPSNKLTSIYTAIKGGGIIVMDDVIMAITINNPSDKITEVTVLNSNQEIVFKDLSCTSNQCSFNLSFLKSGAYTVIVHTQQNDLFTGEINR